MTNLGEANLSEVLAEAIFGGKIVYSRANRPGLFIRLEM
jgi:hypothetical protein